MGKYSSLESMYADFKKQVADSITEIVPPIMKDKMQEAIEFEVYARYEPREYIRREEDGGLKDRDNIIDDIKIEGNKIIISITNIARTNMEYPNNNGDMFLNSLIVYGDKYTWEGSKIYKLQPYPRDFYEATNELLEDNDIRNQITYKLKSKGIIVK